MCDTPYFLELNAALVRRGFTTDVPVPCGKCPVCKSNRKRDWIFRLKQESKASLIAHFITLTYDNKHLPYSGNGYGSLYKPDLQKFWKRLRKNTTTDPRFPKIKYYAVGEYGSQRKRPHYHAIVFNVPDSEMFHKSWKLGKVDAQLANGPAIAYTLDYIDKPHVIPMFKGDDRLPEFSVMSRGLGEAYMTPGVVAYHKSNLDNSYVVQEGGYKQRMPRYYKKRIYDETEQLELSRKAAEAKGNYEEQEYVAYLEMYGDNSSYTFEQHLNDQRLSRYNRFYSQQKDRKDV